ncbi:unnamed protein product [Durusdinium trenchii]|uniref:PBZ-type domain-containing protein n=1 Tax=Durusdinium trenchii TaxID=1381693 RepID=A0ABP0JJ73_9DINO
MSRMRRGSTKATGATRPLCSYGTKCYRRNPEHLTDQAHPWDEDYLTCCLEKGHSPEFVSIRMLFEWVEMQDEATGTERARATRHWRFGLKSNVWDKTSLTWTTIFGTPWTTMGTASSTSQNSRSSPPRRK